MAKRCALTGKSIQFGNNVSHSQRKTRRRFDPNMQKISVLSETLGERITLKIPVSTLRTIEHNGGIDSFLLNTSNLKLTADAITLKNKIKRKVTATA
ncbi:MAG: 50S ribosomal protein L28 [Alphaproteobacteria bacterium]|nr:MAG: 50S ribosomal protein L28 [Alphaproteobacteria bacterium]TAE83528.1 MAG: 50S ribosomal protein L28 [Alphaproteobacteria bacterium]TAF15949.1 MAG: 50S ribosomal protein L28 [Alphaproteobacteria bacterium]TAF41934.1 MAG: 50S ribosomal protein L28 [Alphaproteobacteria bacterium]TAF76763.1 MAG: 50S ribosomal protein L28 [Alphaproteobacteria bacterium]